MPMSGLTWISGRGATFQGPNDSRNYVSKPARGIGMLTFSYATHGGRPWRNFIGYARVSTRQQSTDRQQADLLAAGVRRDDLYIDHGVSGTRAARPQFDRASGALIAGDTLVITLDRLGRSTQNMLALADEIRSRRAGLRVLNLGRGDVDTATPMGSMLFTVMAALAQMESEIKCERVVDSLNKRREAGGDLGGRPRRVTDSQIRSAVQLVKAGKPAAQVAGDLGMSLATFYRRSRALTDQKTSM